MAPFDPSASPEESVLLKESVPSKESIPVPPNSVPATPRVIIIKELLIVTPPNRIFMGICFWAIWSYVESIISGFSGWIGNAGVNILQFVFTVTWVGSFFFLLYRYGSVIQEIVDSADGYDKLQSWDPWNDQIRYLRPPKNLDNPEVTDIYAYHYPLDQITVESNTSQQGEKSPGQQKSQDHEKTE